MVFPRKETARNTIFFTEQTIVKVFDVAIRYQNRELYERVCLNCEVKLSPQFFSWISARVRESNLPLNMLGSALEYSVFALKTLGDQYNYILSLDATGAAKRLWNILLNIFDEMVDFCSTSALYEQDGETLIHIACYRRDYSWVTARLCPLVKSRCESVAFALGFSWQLYNSALQQKLTVSDKLEYLKNITKNLVTQLHVSQIISEQGFQRQQQRRATQETILPPPPPVTKDSLVNLCSLLLQLDLVDTLHEFTRKLMEQCDLIDVLELFDLFIPFVAAFVDLLESRSIPLEHLYYSLIRTIVTSFWIRYVDQGESIRDEPRDGIPLRCPCVFCKSVSSHILRFDDPKWEFASGNRVNREHVESVLRTLGQQGHCSYTRIRDGKYPKWAITRLPRAHEHWERRAANARRQLESFNQIRLQEALGPDYSRITGKEAPYPSSTAPPVPEHVLANAQAYLSGSTVPSLYPSHMYMADGLPSVAEFQHLSMYSNEGRDSADHVLQTPQHSPLGTQSPSMHLSVSGLPSSVTRASATNPFREQSRSVYTGQQGQHTSRPLPERVALAPFPQNLAWIPGPDSTGHMEGLKRKHIGNGNSVGDRPVKR
ncbi:hypothetical protein M426DRAFT_239806 [Hypoxylon sp. CI-4A]|nr:hypothetical protein M426DRAFT_239806 [Hypoxylon sp. CI-4A]